MRTAPIPTILTEARKFGLSLILSNQELNQLPVDQLHSILGTVDTQTVFQLGLLDAQKLAPLFAPDISAADILNLGKWRIAVRTRANGKPVFPFIMNTVKPDNVQNPIAAEALRQQVTDTNLSLEEVENWIEQRYADIDSEPPVEEPPESPKPRSPKQKQPPPAKDMPEAE